MGRRYGWTPNKDTRSDLEKALDELEKLDQGVTIVTNGNHGIGIGIGMPWIPTPADLDPNKPKRKRHRRRKV